MPIRGAAKRHAAVRSRRCHAGRKSCSPRPPALVGKVWWPRKIQDVQRDAAARGPNAQLMSRHYAIAGAIGALALTATMVGSGTTALGLAARSADGTQAREAFRAGVQELDSGDFSQAQRLFRQAVTLAPQWDLAYLHLGMVEHRLEPGSAASIQALEEAIRLGPDNPRARYFLGLAYEQAGRMSDAAAALGAALKLRAGFVDAWFHLGSVLEAGGDPDGAVRAYREVLSRQRDHLGALTALAALYESQNDLDSAERALLAIVESNPQVAYHHYRLAQFYERVGRA